MAICRERRHRLLNHDPKLDDISPLCHTPRSPLIFAAMPVPVFGFLAFTSGSYEGAIIRDMRLVNDLHRRGFKVHVYWLMEKNPEFVDEGIPQSVLARGTRFQFRRPSR